MLTFTVYRDGPWWVGVLEWDESGLLYAARHIFEAEPQNEEILAYVLGDWLDLFGHRLVGVAQDAGAAPALSPKRRLREVARQAERRGVSDAAQAALDRSRAAFKQERRSKRR
ncbi:MAG TPA: YjdF family protein [Herpetosiphonaceae bacterium]|nr:YjdF family protein [Herpetosiphonaceae bacterium]